jgi:hypothetical protein
VEFHDKCSQLEESESRDLMYVFKRMAEMCFAIALLLGSDKWAPEWVSLVG